MIRLSRFLLSASCLCGFALATQAADIKGVLMDDMCSGKADLRISGATSTLVGGRIVAEAHTKECLLKPACEKSGYGVYTDDNKFLRFDAAGNRKALAAIKASAKLDDFEVEVYRRGQRRHDQGGHSEDSAVTGLKNNVRFQPRL